MDDKPSPTKTDSGHRPNPLRMSLAVATAAWMGILGYLLLTSSLPRVPFFTSGDVSPVAHFSGTLLLAVQLVLLARTRQPTGYRRAALLGLVGSLGFVLALELFQEIRPVRAYQLSDTLLNISGAFAGVALTSVVLQFRVLVRPLGVATIIVTATLALALTGITIA